VDGVHQFVGKLEVVEAGLAFLRLDHEVFEFPQAGLGFGLALAAWFGVAGCCARTGSVAGLSAAAGAGLGVALARGARRPVAVPARGGVTATGAAAGGAASRLPNIFLSALSTVISSIG
jgi:hypothetical protein